MAGVRIAMWSGPRNISTAMMRSWGNRPDTSVTDEPLYGHYLQATGLEHPGRDEVIASQPRNWRDVVQFLTGPTPGGKPIWYQKHMSHHLLPMIGREWLEEVTNAFLIREPREMLTSLVKVTPNPGLEDTGLPQQVELFESERKRTGRTPAVLDARDVLENPKKMLGLLCEAVGVAFDERMLSWPRGRRATDGVWAKHWYGAVEKSTGFEEYRPKDEPVPERLANVLEGCESLYARLQRDRLR